MCANRASEDPNLFFFFGIIGDFLIKYLNPDESEEVPSMVSILLAAGKLAQVKTDYLYCPMMHSVPLFTTP